MKAFLTFFVCLPLFALAQLTLADLVNLNKSILRPYQKDQESMLAAIEGLQAKGYLVTSHLYERLIDNQTPRADYFYFSDLNNDAVKEVLSLTTTPVTLVGGGRPAVEVRVTVQTDNLAQYHKWLVDLKTLRNFSLIEFEPFTKTYDEDEGLWKNRITVTRPYKSSADSRPPVRERTNSDPGIYSISVIFTRTYPL